MVEWGKDDRNLLIQDSDSGELTLENTNTCIRKDDPVLIPPTEEPIAKEQNTKTADEWTKSSHGKRRPPSWTHDF